MVFYNNGGLVYNIESLEDCVRACEKAMEVLGKHDLKMDVIRMTPKTLKSLYPEPQKCVAFFGIPVTTDPDTFDGTIHISPGSMYEFPGMEKKLDSHGYPTWVTAKGVKPEPDNIMLGKYKEIANLITRTRFEKIVQKRDTFDSIEKIVLRDRELIKYTEEELDEIFGR